MAAHRRSLALTPSRARSAYNLAVSLQTATKWAEAQPLYDSAIALAGTADGGELDVASAYSNLGVTWQALGRLPAADEAFRAALRLAPGQRSANFNRCNLLLAIASPADSARCFETLVRARPDDVDVVSAAAGVCHLDGQHARAAELYALTLEVPVSILLEREA